MKQVIRNYFKSYEGLPKEIYVIFIARMINAMGIFVFPLLIILMNQELGMTPKESGLVMMIGGFIFTFSSLLGGKLVDTLGRKKILVVFDTIAALFYMTCAFLPITKLTLALLMSAMFCYGMSDPAHGALVADLTNKENRENAFSLTYLGFNLGFALGPTLGGILFSKKMFFLFFMGDAVTALIGVTLITLFIPETIHLTKDDTHLADAEKNEEGSIFKVVLSRPVLIVFSAIMLGYNFVYEQWSFLIPLHASEIYGKGGAALYGILASFNGLVVIVFTPYLTSKLEGKRNTWRIIIGGLLYFAGFSILGFFETKAAFFVTVFLMTLGEIIVVISFMPFIINHTPASHRGRMNSVLPMIIGLGHTISPYVMGTALEYISIPRAWHFISLLMLVSVLGMYLLDQKEKSRGVAVEANVHVN